MGKVRLQERQSVVERRTGRDETDGNACEQGALRLAELVSAPVCVQASQIGAIASTKSQP
jgi:hypothetical protein